MTAPDSDPIPLARLALSTHSEDCKEQLRFLRARAGRKEHRAAVLGALCATRRDRAAVEAGDLSVAKRISDELLRVPALPESALVFDSTRSRREVAELRAMFHGLCLEHEAWLASYPARHLSRWCEQESNDTLVEGAIWEALCRRWLLHFADAVEPAEDMGGAGPDFRCATAGTSFYVESTCLTIDAATRCTGLSDVSTECRSYAVATQRVWAAVEAKERQCRSRVDAPTLVFVGTLHQGAAWSAMGERVATELLTGRPLISWQIHVENDVQIGSSGPYMRTDLHGAAYVAADGLPEAPLGARNRHVAAVLVGDVGMFYPYVITKQPPFVGAVHPDPVISFDPLLSLPGVRFLRLRRGWHEGSIEVEDVVVRRPTMPPSTR